MLRGGREQSPSRRTSENRPHGYREETSPFQADRLALGEAQARAREQHRQNHRRLAARMEVFAHPACEPLSKEERQLCPLLTVRWTKLRDIPQGIELEAVDRGLDVRRLRLQLLCHIAYGKAHAEQGCPLQQPTISVSVLQRGESVIVRLTVESEELQELREQVRLATDLIDPGG